LNLVLFSPEETGRPLPRADRRADHILEVLRRKPGDTFDAGLVNGPLGKATLIRLEPKELHLSFAWGETPPAPPPLTLVVGLPRPQTARDILRDATTMGATTLCFVTTGRSEPSYARSKLWTTGEWRRHVLAGAEQAFSTFVPEVKSGDPLVAAVGSHPAATMRLALDHYEAAHPLATVQPTPGRPVVLAIGPERGWTRRDREILQAAKFDLVHLGRRVLRTETAVIAALTLIRARTEAG
jgi:16S rRNA (uracil1498-N3)-methyltransferase